MAETLMSDIRPRLGRGVFTWGLFWFGLLVAGAVLLFWPGIDSLLVAWATPEYSHGPLIPVLSTFLFLRQLKYVPVNTGDVGARWPGVVVITMAILLGSFGRVIEISDLVAYSVIIFVGGVLLTSFGWRTGRHLWPSVLHLVYMLPLPGVVYYLVSTKLQLISSVLGVYFLQLLNVPVFLEGNIIDLGVYKLQVAEACSGLRYLFPILSFSYVFAVLYRGPVWHKAVLLVSAVPITVLMNSVRIAVAGIIVDRSGIEHVEGFSHFFEGWVIFVICVLILFALAKLMLFFRPDRPGLVEALDLETSGLATQAIRLGLVQPSRALILASLLMLTAGLSFLAIPNRGAVAIERAPFSAFPRHVGDWTTDVPQRLEADVEKILGADDYYAANYAEPGAASQVELFMAWYHDQLHGGTHSPTLCLPGAGWEIAKIEPIESPVVAEGGVPFTLNRAVIQKGVQRMLVYYWFDQQGSRTASEYSAKWVLTTGKMLRGRNDGAIVRLITPINEGETEAVAEARLIEMMRPLLPRLPQFLPQ